MLVVYYSDRRYCSWGSLPHELCTWVSPTRLSASRDRGILAYLLEPVIIWLIRRRVPRKKAVIYVNVGFNLFIIILAILILRPAIQQGRKFFDEDNLTNLKAQAGKLVDEKRTELESEFGKLPFYQKAEDWLTGEEALTWASDRLKQFGGEIVTFFGTGISGAATALGYIVGLFLVPIYLFFFLRESTSIAQNWSNYLPLRESQFKDEVVATLKEINGYLIAYFRGQMLVSMIDGLLIAIALKALGLPYAFLLGVLLAILGLIPYIGSLLVMIPAALIALVHFSTRIPISAEAVDQYPPGKIITHGSGEAATYEIYAHTWGIMPNQVWAYVAIVIGIFIVLQQVNGLITAPKIVGDSVGLHPLTVIFSMLFWSLLMGGILGALLAVPLTASVKVLFRRYVWERRIAPGVERRLKENKKKDPAETKGIPPKKKTESARRKGGEQ